MTIGKPQVGSTADVVAPGFKPHGRVDMWMENDVLQYEATGPFNAEVFDRLAVAQGNFLKSLTFTGPWASICTVRQSAMATPEAIQRYTDLMQRPKPQSFEPLATAFVVGEEVEGAKIMAPHFERVYSLINRPFKIFQTMEQAKQWVCPMIAASRLRRD